MRGAVWTIPKLKYIMMVVILLEYHLKNKYGRNEKIQNQNKKKKRKKKLKSYTNLKLGQRKKKLKK